MKNTQKLKRNQIKISDITNKVVFSEDEIKQIGKVVKVTFDHNTKNITSLVIRESIWNRELFQVLAKNIKNIGDDLINITSKKDCYPITSYDDLTEMTFKSLHKYRVVTDNGNLIGIVEDIIVSKKTFTLGGFIFKDNSVLVIDPDEISIGKDEIIVPETYEKLVSNKTKDVLIERYVSLKNYKDLDQYMDKSLEKKTKLDYKKDTQENVDYL